MKRSKTRDVAVTIAGLSVALLTAPMLQGAETVVHQTSGGRSAYVDSYEWDQCGERTVSANPSTYQMVSKGTGGKTTVADASTLNAWAGGSDYCTGIYWFVEFDAVALTASQFHLDSALNQATLQGDVAASWGYSWNGNGDFVDLTGTPVSFAIQWQGTGTGPTAPKPTRKRVGSSISIVNATATTVEAIASGSVSSGAHVAILNLEAEYALLSQNLKVSTTIKRNYPIVVPAGQTVSLTNATLSACDALTYGYQVNDGPLVAVGSKIYSCSIQPVSDVTIGPFAQQSVLRIYLLDQSAAYCEGYPTSYTFFSDGLHGLVTGKGPWQVDIMDTYGDCGLAADQIRLPDAPGQGNLNVTVVTGP